jgi:serine/threonine-protein kinase
MTGGPHIVWRFGPFRLDERARSLTREGASIVLGGRQLDALLHLLANHARIVPREELFAAAWPGRTVEDNNLTQAIAGLRRALGDDSAEPRIILTVKGRGYRIGVPVAREESAPQGGVAAPAPRRWPWRRAAGLGVAVLLSLAVWRGLAMPSPAPTVAVLPFANLSGDAAQDYLADGVTEELTDRLGRLPGLTVTGRLSAQSFRGRAAHPDEISRALHAAMLVEGSVRREGAHVTVLARLIDPASGYQTWSGRFDAADNGLLALQADLAERLAGALRLRLSAADRAVLDVGGTRDAAAYDAYLRGIQAARPAGLDAYRAAIADFDVALARDPNFALAYLERATAREQAAELATEPDAAPGTEGATAEADAARAVQLAPGLGSALILQARLLAENHLDMRGAAAALARGRALTQGDSRAALDAAMLEVNLPAPGRAHALDDARRAVAADPLTPQTLSDAAGVFFTAHDYGEAAAMLDAVANLSAHETLIDHNQRAWLALVRGDTAAVLRLCAAETDWEQIEMNALARLQRGETEAATQAIARLHAALGETGHAQYAEIAAARGDAQTAMAELQRAEALHDSGLMGLLTDFLLDPLRSRADFKALLTRLGLTPN